VSFLGYYLITTRNMHRVLIASPKEWRDGGRVSCMLAPPGGSAGRWSAVHAELPLLDCGGSAEREMSAMDVEFLGEFRTAIERREDSRAIETTWACSRIAGGIQCRP
jgi:hypothetical protein